ncbi:MAG: helix-turn-helix transcriptional regulator [Spirochaetales bacterium]|nr:helix-turn-helix transcriptional regulator [Spirochaetales bacterium]
MSLRQIREKSGYRQLDLAEYLGVTQVTYHRYESGEREPSIEQLKKLSAFFSVSIDSILDNCAEEKDVLSQYERQLIEAARNADKRARTDALMLLKANDRSSI